MKKIIKHSVSKTVAVILIIVIAIFAVINRPSVKIKKALVAFQDNPRYSNLTIEYPNDQTLFPPDIAPAMFHWKDGNNSNTWIVSVKFHDVQEPINILTLKSDWTPSLSKWRQITKLSLEKNAQVTILGINYWKPDKILSAARITFQTSKDPAGAPIFYREVNLPFIDAVKDPSKIRWRFGAISSPNPPVVLTGLPVCGNCHSFNANGDTLAMDIDYANNKGSYVITKVAEDMALATSDIITWDTYKKDDGELTFGLLSQISPDGRYVISTVKDESVFVPKPPLAFSQLFFPVKGILCIYDRQNRTFRALPGADDPNYVQSNASWSPDGKYIIFAKSKVHKLEQRKNKKTVLLSAEECREFLEDNKPFKFDLYRIPFNDGNGGTPEPIEGASNNGMSNYFAKYSPDGKWIVFCKAENYMLLQPDSELYIVPADGGQPRRMNCNTNLMNSWHSWSPNSKWLVFTSKTNSPYTQLFLTHIDENGQSSPPVMLSNFTQHDRAANIPEFVNASPKAIARIRQQFIDDLSYVRAANECLKANDFDGVERGCRKALELNPQNYEAHHNLAVALASHQDYEQAVKHWLKVIEINPKYVETYYNLGQVMCKQQNYQQAIDYWSKAIQLKPDYTNAHANMGAILLALGQTNSALTHLSKAAELNPDNPEVHYNLAQTLFRLDKPDDAIKHLLQVIRLRPNDINANYDLGVAFARQQNLVEATKYFSQVIKLKPDHTDALHNLGVALAQQGDISKAIKYWLEAARLAPKDIRIRLSLVAGYARMAQFEQAISTAQKAIDLARAAGDNKLIIQLEQSIELYKKEGKP